MSIYKQVTDKIVAELERGAAPWIKPWSAASTASTDRNIASAKPYQGVNRILLAMQGRQSPHWGTYRQWTERGGQVKRGEQGTWICYYSPLTARVRVTADGEEERDTYRLLKQYVVFNAEQQEGAAIAAAPPAPEAPQRFDPAEALIRANQPNIEYGGGEACYIAAADLIRMPTPESFSGIEHYYATLLHELTHWTGHASRLNRQLSNRFASNAYAAEELIAEIGAAFLCAEVGVPGELRHAGYIQSWLTCLKADNRAVFTAAAAAEKAARFINRIHPLTKE
jgi:antirestriction protein ArdC